MKRCPICESFIDDTDYYCPLCKTKHREHGTCLDTFSFPMMQAPSNVPSSDDLTGTLIAGGIFLLVIVLFGIIV